MYGNDEERRLVRAICNQWDKYEPEQVFGWPEHMIKFRVEWLLELHPDAGQEAFDPTKPWSGNTADFDFGAIGATNIGG
jgi:hypothetical protein